MREATIQKIAVAVGSLLLFSAAALMVFGVSHETRVAQGHALSVAPQSSVSPTGSSDSSAATQPLTPGEQSPQKPEDGAKPPTTSTRPEEPERETITTAPRDSEDSEDSESDSSAKLEDSKNEYDGEQGATDSNKSPDADESTDRNKVESQGESQ